MVQENGEDELHESQYSRSCSRKSEGSGVERSVRSSSEKESQSKRSDSDADGSRVELYTKNKASAEKSDDFLLCSKCIKIS
jgi:hypothetical protein